jgi:hypothetical protein
MGRPPKKPGEAKGVMFCIRLTADEKAKIDAAAGRGGLGSSEWARAVLLSAASTAPRGA